MTRSSEEKTRFYEKDRDFVALIDNAFADAAARSGPHLLCRPRCSQCCIGVFAIGPADVLRLQTGLAILDQQDPTRAFRVRQRAALSWARLAPQFPGDPDSGLLTVDDHGEPQESFEDFGNQEPCPALDPVDGTCDLYRFRPHTCRVFGPPLANEGGFGICELCFQGATPEEITAAAIAPEPHGISEALDEAALAAGVAPGRTIIAFALRSPRNIPIEHLKP